MSFSTKIMFLRVKRDNLSCHLQLDDRFLQTTGVMFVHFTGFISTLFNNTCDHIQKSWRGADLHFGRRNNGEDVTAGRHAGEPETCFIFSKSETTGCF